MLDSADIGLVQRAAWRMRIDTFANHLSNGRYKIYPHIRWAINQIQPLLMAGDARVVIEWPPRHCKSETFSYWMPAWAIEWDPNVRVILASYGADLASSFCARVRDVFIDGAEPWTRRNARKNKANDWRTVCESGEGGMRSAGVGGPVTGHGGDIILVDDPYKNWEEAQSPIIRRKVQDWFDSTLYTRAEPGASIVLVQTRWHERDLAGYLMDRHPDNWIRFRLPAMAEADDPMGRELDAALCAERYDEVALRRIKKAIGPFKWAGLYQQRPAPLEGGVIKRIGFKFYTELPDEMEDLAHSWDMSFKDTSRSSYVVDEVWGRKGANTYLIDLFHERIDFTDTLHAMRHMSGKHPEALAKLVEDKANGPAVINALKDEVPGILPINPTSSKEARLHAVAPRVSAGNVWLPHPDIAPWVEDFIDEVCAFPNAAYDDQADSFSQYHNWLADADRDEWDFSW